MTFEKLYPLGKFSPEERACIRIGWNAAQQEQRGLLREVLEALKLMLPENNKNDWDKGRPTFKACENARDTITKLTAALEKPCTKS